MAVPRVFISSTYYDLKQVRNNIGDFIKGLGYEPIMHEKSGVTYTQSTPLENDCYNELSTCDIVVCILGNHFGSKSSENDLSITMNELETAIKHKKKVYVFISNDVYIENRTYEINKDNGTFKSAYTDDIKIHEFICSLNAKANTYLVVTPFENTEQIVQTLRSQFAGLFQNLLSREATLTEAKTAYDLQQIADNIKYLINNFDNEQNDFFKKFNSTIFASNVILNRIKTYLGMKESSFFANNLTALDEFMGVLNFISEEVDDPFEDIRKYVQHNQSDIKTLTLKNDLFDDNGQIKDVRKKDILDKSVLWEVTEIDNDDLPF